MKSRELYRGTAEILAGIRSARTRDLLVEKFTDLFVHLSPAFDPIRFREAVEAYETVADVGKNWMRKK